MGSPTEPLDLTLSDLEGEIQGHPDFEALYLVTEIRQAFATSKH